MAATIGGSAMSDSEDEQLPSEPIAFARLEYGRPAGRVGKSPLAILAWLIAGILAFLILGSTLIPSLNRARQAENCTLSRLNLKQIGVALQMYANDHNHQFPDSLSTILATGNITADVFMNPGGSGAYATGPTTQALLADFVKPGRCDYLYFGAGLFDTGDPATITACEATGSQTWSGMNVLFLDGHVEFVDQPAAQQLRAALASGGPVAWTSTGGITRPATQRTTRP
jgi:prepilin-type processing-associated H-X9-DG protein